MATATNTIYYAVEIDTGGSDTDTDIGLNSGVIRLITDSPGYDGTPTYPTLETGGNVTDVYYEGIISKDGVGGVSRACLDLDISGGYGTVSNFSLSVVNYNKFWKQLSDLDINLVGKDLQLYVVIDDVFYYAYNGMISEIAYDETQFTIQCSSNYKKIHKTFPPNSFNETEFPNIIEDVKGDTIPVTLGKIENAKIYPTVQKSDFIILNILSDVNYENSVYTTYLGQIEDGITYPLLYLNTYGVSFESNELAGKWIYVFSGADSDATELVKIRSNGATGASAANQTTVVLDRMITDTIADLNTYKYNSTATSDTWVIKISNTRYGGVVSNGFINSFDGSGSQVKIKTYDKDRNLYIDRYGIIESIESAAPEVRDKINFNTNGISVDEEVKIIENSRSNDSVTDLKQDDDRSTSENFNYLGGGAYSTSYSIDVTDTLVDFCKSSENIYIGMDIDFPGKGSACTASYGFTVNSIVDIFGNNFTGFPASSSTIQFDIQSAIEANLIPNEYYGTNGNTNGESSMFGGVDDAGNTIEPRIVMPTTAIDALSSGLAKTLVINVTISISNPPLASNITAKNLGIFSYDPVSLVDGDFYTKVNGEKVGGSSATDNVYNSFVKIINEYDVITFRTFGDLPTTRTGWTVGRQIVDQKNSFDYLRQLAQHSFVEIVQKRNGQLFLETFRELSTTVADFDEDTIIKDSIKSWDFTPLSNVYNEFVLKYNYDLARKKYTRNLVITNVDQSTFPSIFDSTGSDADITTFDAVSCNDDTYFTMGFVSDPSGSFSVGDTVSFVASDVGFYFGFATVTHVDTTPFLGIYYVLGTLNADKSEQMFYNQSGTFPVLSNAGTITVNGTSTQAWKTYAQGFATYSMASVIWGMAHDTYTRIEQVNTAPKNLSELPWYIDENEFDTGTSSGATDTYAVYQYLYNLINYCSRQKYRVTFDIPITTDNIQRELIDLVTFSDAIYTNNVSNTAYIEKINLIPQDDIMRLTLLVIPTDLPSGIIEETMSAPDVIEETMIATDQIEEVL